jgi:hypothetical protein
MLYKHEIDMGYAHDQRVQTALEWQVQAITFGFPLSYRIDVLETTAVLAELGYGNEPSLGNALQFILSKQDSQGRWKMEKTLNGKMWADIEEKGKPSKWVTLRALRVLRMSDMVFTDEEKGVN